MRRSAPSTRSRRHRRRGPLRVLLRAAVVIVLVALVALGVPALVLSLTDEQPRDVEGWQAATPMPEARGEGSGTVLETAEGPRLAVVGGLSGPGRTSDRVSLYDPHAGTWAVAPPLPEPRHHTAAASIEDTLYVTGGAASAGELRTPTSELWALQADGSSWETLESLPQPRWGHRLVALGERLYVIGGQPTADVQVYRPGEGWTVGAPVPLMRDHLGVVVLDGEIWALGGRDADDELTDRVDVYDPEADEWRDGPSLPTPVSAAAVGVVEGRIHVVGGEDPATFGGGMIDAHWVLDPSTGSWEAGPRPPLPVHGAADAVVEDHLYVMGGASRQGLLSVLAWTSDVQVLSPQE